MEDFQGKYNGKQIEQLLDKANDIDLSKYALKTDNAPTATKLQAARTIALSGAVTGSVSSDFGSILLSPRHWRTLTPLRSRPVLSI